MSRRRHRSELKLEADEHEKNGMAITVVVVVVLLAGVLLVARSLMG